MLVEIMTDDLPPLPEPRIERHECELWGQNILVDLFDQQQMAAYARASVEAQRAENERLQHQANNDICEIERLRRALHDIAEECDDFAAEALGRTSRPQPELLTEDPDHGDDA